MEDVACGHVHVHDGVRLALRAPARVATPTLEPLVFRLDGRLLDAPGPEALSVTWQVSVNGRALPPVRWTWRDRWWPEARRRVLRCRAGCPGPGVHRVDLEVRVAYKGRHPMERRRRARLAWHVGPGDPRLQ